jgi:hypothetical protein
MKIKKGVSFILMVLMLLGVITPLSTTVILAAPSYDKAEIYFKISTSARYSKTETTKDEEGSGSTCNTTGKDEVSFIVEGTTKLKSDIFDTSEGFKQLLPVERDIKASCSGGGSKRINGTRLLTNPKSRFVLQQRLFPYSYKADWSYSMDGKKLLNEYDEVIELINSLNIYPSEKKGGMPSYEINVNADALASINYYHNITRGTSSSKSQDYEGSYSDSGVIEGDGSYGLSLLCATGYTEAIESDKAQNDFIRGEFKLEKDKFVSTGSFSYDYEIDENTSCIINVQFSINRDPLIKNIQVNQGLGRYEYTDDDNYVPVTDFVAGKETAIQVFFFDEVPIDNIEDAKLEVYREGIRIAVLKDFKKDKDNNALNFIPNNIAQCENWKEGNYKFKALYKDTDFVLDNVKVTKMPKLRILAVPLKANYEGVVKSPGNQWMSGHSFIKKVFPLANVDIEWIIRPEHLDVSSYMYNLNSNEGKWKVSEQLKRLQVSDSGAQYDVIIGFMAESTADCAGYTYRKLSVIISNGDPDMPATVAHEIGHLYNLGEEYKGGFYNTSVNMPPYGYKGKDWFDNKKPASGTNKEVKTSKHGDGVNISKNLHPFEVGSRGLLEDSINFMGGSAAIDNIWITPSVWRHLFNAFLVKSNNAPKENEDKNIIALQPSGYITESGELKLEYPWKVTYVEDEPEIQTDIQTGTYEIQALDVAGTVLARQYFTPIFSPVTYNGQSNAPSESNKFSLNNVSIPFPEGTAKFNFIKDNTLIKEIPVNGKAPTVSLTTQTDSGEFSENKTIEWEGNDPDGDKLYYTVEYSHNGLQWLVLKSDITDSQLTVDFSLLPGGENAVIRVIASDGINSSKSDSNTFKVPTKPPQLFVDAPNVLDDGVMLNASAYDSADGWMYDDRIKWTSDKDGEIGKGSTLFLTKLSVGKHVVIITAENNHGQKVEEKINFTVEKSRKSSSSLLTNILNGLTTIGNVNGIIFWAAVILVVLLIVVIIIRAVTKKKKCPKYDICPNCGKQNTPKAKFCTGCGNKLKA